MYLLGDCLYFVFGLTFLCIYFNCQQELTYYSPEVSSCLENQGWRLLIQVHAGSIYFGPVPCPFDLVPMGEKQEREVFHEKQLVVSDGNYEQPLESKDLKTPEFSMEKAALKSPKVFSEDLDLISPNVSMEPSMKRRKKY